MRQHAERPAEPTALGARQRPGRVSIETLVLVLTKTINSSRTKNLLVRRPCAMAGAPHLVASKTEPPERPAATAADGAPTGTQSQKDATLDAAMARLALEAVSADTARDLQALASTMAPSEIPYRVRVAARIFAHVLVVAMDPSGELAAHWTSTQRKNLCEAPSDAAELLANSGKPAAVASANESQTFGSIADSDDTHPRGLTKSRSFSDVRRGLGKAFKLQRSKSSSFLGRRSDTASGDSSRRAWRQGRGHPDDPGLLNFDFENFYRDKKFGAVGARETPMDLKSKVAEFAQVSSVIADIAAGHRRTVESLCLEAVRETVLPLQSAERDFAARMKRAAAHSKAIAADVKALAESASAASSPDDGSTAASACKAWSRIAHDTVAHAEATEAVVRQTISDSRQAADLLLSKTKRTGLIDSISSGSRRRLDTRPLFPSKSSVVRPAALLNTIDTRTAELSHILDAFRSEIGELIEASPASHNACADLVEERDVEERPPDSERAHRGRAEEERAFRGGVSMFQTTHPPPAEPEPSSKHRASSETPDLGQAMRTNRRPDDNPAHSAPSASGSKRREAHYDMRAVSDRRTSVAEHGRGERQPGRAREYDGDSDPQDQGNQIRSRTRRPRTDEQGAGSRLDHGISSELPRNSGGHTNPVSQHPGSHQRPLKAAADDRRDFWRAPDNAHHANPDAWGSANDDRTERVSSRRRVERRPAEPRTPHSQIPQTHRTSGPDDVSARDRSRTHRSRDEMPRQARPPPPSVRELAEREHRDGLSRHRDYKYSTSATHGRSDAGRSDAGRSDARRHGSSGSGRSTEGHRPAGARRPADGRSGTSMSRARRAIADQPNDLPQQFAGLGASETVENRPAGNPHMSEFAIEQWGRHTGTPQAGHSYKARPSPHARNPTATRFAETPSRQPAQESGRRAHASANDEATSLTIIDDCTSRKEDRKSVYARYALLSGTTGMYEGYQQH